MHTVYSPTSRCRRIKPGALHQRSAHAEHVVLEVSGGVDSSGHARYGAGKITAVATLPLKRPSLLHDAHPFPVLFLWHARTTETMGPSSASVTLQSFHVATNSFLANYTVGCLFAVGRHGYLLTLEKCIERIR